jgi:hypothetical protein
VRAPLGLEDEVQVVALDAVVDDAKAWPPLRAAQGIIDHAERSLGPQVQTCSRTRKVTWTG